MAQRQLNQELESLRNSGLNHQLWNHESAVKELVKLTDRLHSAWLFHRPIGSPALRSLCKSLTVMYDHQQGNWRDFCGALGIEPDEIRCIDNTHGITDRAEIALKTYSQEENATIGSIVRALDTLERQDAVRLVSPHLKKLFAEVNSMQRNNEGSQRGEEEEADSGYYSSQGSDARQEEGHLIIKPSGYRHLSRELPLSLQKPYFQIQSLNQTRRTRTVGRTNESLVAATPTQTDRNKPAWKKSVFLTFATDGEEAAYRMAEVLRHPVDESRPPIGVLILDENSERLVANTEATIVKLFNQVDYVMPIITDGYLEATKFEPGPCEPTDTLSSLDARYAYFVQDLMRNYYVENKCLNDKIRCVVPDQDKTGVEIRKLLKAPAFRWNPLLKVWAYESGLEKLARRLHGIPI